MKELEKERYRKEMVKKEAEAVEGKKNRSVYRKIASQARGNKEKRSSHFHRTDPIDDLIDDICCEERQPKMSSRKKRKTLERPENWEIIAEHYSQWGMRTTIRNFPTELA